MAEAVADYDFSACEKFGIDLSDLKDEQKLILTYLLDNNDVLAVLPTGYGKSLTYQMFPLLSPTKGSVMIISPLVSLMKDQISTINSHGFTASMVTHVKDDSFANFIFGSPEVYLDSSRIELLERNADKIILMVIDEVHTVPKWGKPDADQSNKGRRKGQEGAFREYFSHLGELRSFLPNVKILALTATASKLLQSQIKDSLAILDCKVISVCPDRENIRFSIVKCVRDIPTTFYWMVDKLREETDNFPRTVVYCSSVDYTSRLYDYFIAEYPESTMYIGMYHSETDTVIQETHLKEITKVSHSPLRLIFCTTALGMGIDMKNFNNVIHYGLSFDIEGYIQESGRVGRDGEPAHAVLLYHGGMLRDSCPKLCRYIKNASVCRRVKLYEEFATNIEMDQLKKKEMHRTCRCCDVCAILCTCKHCKENMSYTEKYLVPHSTDTDTDSSVISESDSIESDAVLDHSSTDSDDTNL